MGRAIRLVEGIGVSSGVVEGTVRVVTDPTFAEVEPDEVLVTPTTDPSWASIMFVSSALVVDIGGPLSHAAVVARELGHPVRRQHPLGLERPCAPATACGSTGPRGPSRSWSERSRERVSEQGPVLEMEQLGFHLVSRYEDVRRVLKDSETFSNEFPGMFGTGLSFAPATPAKEAAHAKGYRWEPTLFFSDGAAHRRHRGVLQQAFSPRRVRRLEDMVQRLCDEIIDGFDTSGPVDLAEELAFRLPVMVIGEAVGVERADRERFRGWADAVVRRLGEQLPEDEDIELIELYVEAQNYFAAEIAARREQPRDDLLSDIVHAQLEGEDPLTLEELLAIVTILPVAGTETTAGLIGMTLEQLLAEPELMERCRRDGGYLEQVIEETLRHQSPIQAWFRRATREVELSGVTIPKDGMMLVRADDAEAGKPRLRVLTTGKEELGWPRCRGGRGSVGRRCRSGRRCGA